MKRFMHVFFKLVFSRTLIIILSLILQLSVLLVSFWWLGRYSSLVYAGMSLLGTLLLIYLINKEDLPEFKLSWAIIICVLPIVGTILFLFVDKNWGSRGLKREMNRVIAGTKEYLEQEKDVTEELSHTDKAAGALAHYLYETAGYPAYRAKKNTYFRLGEEKWQDMLLELEKAEQFIFLEYFIVEPGIMWNSVLEILKRKAAEGVEVRFLYDGMCSLLLLPYNYAGKMEKLGIHTRAFAQIVPILSTHQNNRDHRKILVIDGRVAYTGGVNLADEYINRRERFGHWKDVAVKITGKAVDSFTVMFLRNWDTPGKQGDYTPYLKQCEHAEAAAEPMGFVIPYGDGPNSKENVAEKVYLDILNTATDYVHIMTPYLVPNSTFLMMLKYAAQRGVSVKLILPHIPDKKYAFAIARTYYPVLLAAGVEIYEYIPGFVHAKLFTSDDCKAVVGTINLDYRSLYHHFECGAYFYGNPVVAEAEADFAATLEKCRRVTPEYYKSIPLHSRAIGHICRLFAPLM